MDFEQYKQPHESQIEWGLRRRFLEAHADKYPRRNRLLCMASCFINVELYGCQYPNEVMLELKECIDEIYDDVQAFRRQVKERNEVKFVKSSDDAGPQAKSGKTPVNSTKSPNLSTSSSGASTVQPTQSTKTKRLYYGGFVAASKATDEETTSSSSKSSLLPLPNKPACESDQKGHSLNVKSYYGGFVKASQSQVIKMEECSSNISTYNHLPFNNTTIPNVNNFDGPNQLYTQQTSPAQNTFSCLSGLSKMARSEMMRFGQKLKKRHDNLNKRSGNIDVISMISNAAVASKKTVGLVYTETVGGFICSLSLESVDLATSAPFSTKKEAKSDAYTKALHVLMDGLPQMCKDKEVDLRNHPHASQQMLEDEVAHCSNRSNTEKKVGSAGILKRKVENAGIFSGFFIHEIKERTNTATGIVQSSSDFSKRELEWQFEGAGSGIRCIVSLDGTVLGDAVDTGRALAKKAASEMALKVLRRHCWTVVVKQMTESEDKVSRDAVLEQPSDDPSAPLKSGIGGKLLKMMGWSGGGIGKYEQGIAEPISVTKVVRRQGLGMSATADITPRIREMVQEFINSNDGGDLVFSSDFSKAERAKIHAMCTRFHLKSQSYGQGAARYLVVSVKRTASELFDHIAKQGGETNKYLLLPPREEEADLSNLDCKVN